MALPFVPAANYTSEHGITLDSHRPKHVSADGLRLDQTRMLSASRRVVATSRRDLTSGHQSEFCLNTKRE